MKSLLAYLGLRVGMGLIGALPARAARGLGRFAGTIWQLFDPGRREMARKHMNRVLGDDIMARQAAREVMRSYGRYYAEALWVRGRRVPAILEMTEVEGLEHIIAARDAGKGMIYALPHIGNWDVAAPVAVDVGVPVVAVAENLPNRRITDWFTSMRAELGIEIVLATGRVEVMRSLEDALSKNKAVALLSDRDLGGRGVQVDFFDETTTLPPGPATLGVRTGAPVLPVASYFAPHGYRLVIRPALSVPEAATRGDQVALMTQDLAVELEKLVREAPQQWHLVVPNWPSDSA